MAEMINGDTVVTPDEQATEDVIKPLRDNKYSEPIEEMVKLLSQSKCAFLIGAGCSKCANLPLMEELTEKVLEKIAPQDKTRKILTGLVEQYTDAECCTIEDYMSELVDLIAIAERHKIKKSKVETIPIGANTFSLEELCDALLEIKQQIERIILETKIKIKLHRKFIQAIHGRLHSGKSDQIQTVDYFTLNYDTLIEDALSLERIPTADGFNGGATGWWNANAYYDKKAHARVLKLHGSVDWCLLEDDVLPSRIRHSLKEEKTEEPVLIWPATTKYREVQRDPFAQIIDIMRKTLRPTKNSEAVLAIIGYSFCDSHINYEIDRALRESGGRLNLLIYTNANEPKGIIREWLNDPKVMEDVRIHANRGFFHADNQIVSENDLPWWKFEVLVRLLGGER